MTLPLTKKNQSESLPDSASSHRVLPIVGWVALILVPFIITAGLVTYAFLTYNKTYEAQVVNDTTFKTGTGVLFPDIFLGILILGVGLASGIGGVAGLRSHFGKTNSDIKLAPFALFFALFFVLSGMPSIALNSSGSAQLTTQFYLWLKNDHNLVVEPGKTSLVDMSSADGYSSPLFFAEKPQIVKDSKGKENLVIFKTNGNLITIDSISPVNK